MIEKNREFESDEPVHFASNEWLRDPFRTMYHAMSELEQSLGEPRGAFGYTGYAEIEDLEEGIWKPRAEDDLQPSE